MSKHIRKSIRSWFASHEDDPEFAYSEDPAPFWVNEPPRSRGRIIYTTKRHPVELALQGGPRQEAFGMIAHYGLPAETDLDWIRALATSHELHFLGDMDPVDLLVFAWLRAGLELHEIVHLGISDTYLSALRTSIPASFVIPLAPAERESLLLLPQVLPDYEDLVGANCTRILSAEMKIELEAVVSARGDAGGILLPLTM